MLSTINPDAINTTVPVAGTPASSSQMRAQFAAIKAQLANAKADIEGLLDALAEIEPGVQGPPGPAGPTGATGAPGATGPQGPAGTNANIASVVYGTNASAARPSGFATVVWIGSESVVPVNALDNDPRFTIPD